MARRWRTVARAAVFGGLAFLLGACLKLDMDLEVSADDTVDGSVVFALDKELLELSGQSLEDVLGTEVPVPTEAEGVSAEPYEDDEFAGQEFTFDGVPLQQFNQSEDAEQLQIVREGDVFRVTGVLDLSGATGATGLSGFGEGLAEAFEGAELRVRISFPGDVSESNGDVDGNTVTWEPRVGERLELRATASAIDTGGGGSGLTPIPIVAGAAVVVALVLAALAARRRGAGRPAVVDAAAGEPQAPPATTGGEPMPDEPSESPGPQMVPSPPPAPIESESPPAPPAGPREP